MSSGDPNGESQGHTSADTELVDESFISYVMKPGSSDILFTIAYKLELDETSTLIVERKHLESNIVWTSIFKRQCAID